MIVEPDYLFKKTELDSSDSNKVAKISQKICQNILAFEIHHEAEE